MKRKTNSALVVLAFAALVAGGCMKHETKTQSGATGGAIETTSGQATGAEVAASTDVMTLPASRGNVTFAHKKHQELLKDCTKCHDKGPGKIEGFGKDWAHSRCKGCHSDMKQGPTACNDCHKR